MAGSDEKPDTMARADRSGDDDSSEDEFELVPTFANQYWLEDGDENPISFATLPYADSAEDAVPASDKVFFLRGTQDNGMRLYVKAVAWRIEFTKDIKPTFHVKTEKYWIRLVKPRKSYEEIIRTVVSVAQFLNYAIMNPTASERVAWNHVSEVFSSWETQPSRNDLPAHLQLIRHLISIDERLVGATALQGIDTSSSKKKLTEDGRQNSRKRMHISDDDEDADEPELSNEKKKLKPDIDLPAIDDEMNDLEGTDFDEVGDLSETVCCICDNGGDVICCDGPCMRSFHLNKGASGASDASCTTLGFSKAEVESMDKFFCPNCKLKKHQCYVCGELGCSDESAGPAQEVFLCDAAMCGHFYHPDCVAGVILREKEKSEQDTLAESIREGKGFVCPMHKCWKCGRGENKEEEDLQFGVCRRCPRVWHRKCFPASLLFDATDDEEQRAWEDLLPDRILIYCKRHKIIPKLGTPARDHVKFPEGSLPAPKKIAPKNKVDVEDRKGQLQKKKLKQEVGPEKSMFDTKSGRKASPSMKEIKMDTSRPMKSKADTDIKSKLDKRDPILIKGKLNDSSSRLESALKGRPQERSIASEQKPGKPPLYRDSITQLAQRKNKPAAVFESGVCSMVNALIEKARGSVNIENVQKKLEVPLCYRRAPGKNPGQKISNTRLESIIRGMHKAVETLDTGGAIEDAKAKCSPIYIKTLEAFKNELRVYLSPFLYGARYTSFGRHFTKTERLEEIVERLHWYVQPGDMVVDFCCGANEFSLLMKRKLDEVGKKCEYKNFDVIQTKNDFSFVKKDWFQVKPGELVDGNRLIMGLNPPFGVKGGLATQFIDHALEFKPKLVVLIVPKETERLDQKKEPYDLIWEDLDLLKGESFYLPGSVDVNSNPLGDWNAVAPPLYIWSRLDWTSKHRSIALENGHVSQNSTSGPPRFSGPLYRRPSYPTPPLMFVDSVVESRSSHDVAMEPQNSRVEPKKTENTDIGSDLLDVEDLFENDDQVDMKEDIDGFGRSQFPEKSDEKTADKLARDGKDERRHPGNQSSKTNLNDKRKDSRKDKFSGGDNDRNKVVEAARQSLKKTDSPGKPRHKPEGNHELQSQVRKSHEKHRLDTEKKNDITSHGKPVQKSPEKHRRSIDSGRSSPSKYDKYGLGGKRSPGKYDRHGLIEGTGPSDTSRNYAERLSRPESYRQKSEPTTYGDHRKHSPERYNWEGHSPDERAPEKSRSYGQRPRSPETQGYTRDAIGQSARHGAQRELTPDKSKPSSVVDLESLMSSSTHTKKDMFRDYDTLLRRENSDRDFRDLGSRRLSASGIENEWEDPRRLLSNERASTYYQSRDYLDQEGRGAGMHDLSSFRSALDGMQTRGFDDIARRGSNDFGAGYVPRDPSSDYRSTGALLGGRYGDATYERTDRIRDVYSQYNFAGASSAGGNINSSQIPGRTWPDAGLPALYGTLSRPQQQPLYLNDSLLLASHGLYDNRLGNAQSNHSQYPPQGRYTGQGKGQFSGGWIED